MSNDALIKDRGRYAGRVPLFQVLYRKSRSSLGLLQLFYRVLYKLIATKNHLEISVSTEIGPGLYIGHPYCITINPETVIGSNCNLHKGVTIGQENRGLREGTPTIGDDVLIAPNSYVNRDIPSHSVVFGNPCIVKHRDNATDEYINRRI